MDGPGANEPRLADRGIGPVEVGYERVLVIGFGTATAAATVVVAVFDDRG